MKKITIIALTIITFALNAQTSWTTSSTGFNTNLTALEMAVAPNGDVYASSSHLSGWNAQLTPDLYKSTNGGASWTPINLGSSLGIGKPTSIIFSGTTLLMCGPNPAGTTNYVYASSDYGATWTVSGTGINPTYKFDDFAKAPNGDIYLAAHVAGTSTNAPRLVSSFNSGSSWSEIGMTGIFSSIRPNAIIFDNTGKLYMSASNNLFSKFYTSTNFGSTMVENNSNIPASYTFNDFALGNSGEVFGVCTDYNSTTNVSTPRLLKSANGATSWTGINGITGLTGMNYSYALVNAGGDFLWSCQSNTSGYPGEIYKCFMLKKATITTLAAVNVGDVSADCGINLTSDGRDPNTVHGLCWSTTTNPSIATSQTIVTGVGVGIFTVEINNLQPSTTYYVKAFATNSIGVSYGNEITFTTAIPSGINVIANKTSLSVSPVPASDILKISINGIQKNVNCSIYSVDGTIVLTVQLEEGENSIDISRLSSGLYFLATKNSQKIKIVKE